MQPAKVHAEARFNPRSPCGERRAHTIAATAWAGFNPRSPCGERPSISARLKSSLMFQPTLPLRGATVIASSACPKRLVSTHAPLAGSDAPMRLVAAFQHCFNPRSPCGERPERARIRGGNTGFNPRSPCGERPRSGSYLVAASEFQPTLPLRGATRAPVGRFVSICCFNPRSPCGERHDKDTEEDGTPKFQPTLPLRGATRSPRVAYRSSPVSTHAPLAGSDVADGGVRGGRLVSTHAPLAGSDEAQG